LPPLFISKQPGGAAAGTSVASHIVAFIQRGNSRLMKLCDVIALELLSVALITFGCSHRNQSNAHENQAKPTSSPVHVPVPRPPSVSAKPSQALQIEKTWQSKYEIETKTISKTHEGNRGYKISARYPEIKPARTPSTKRFNHWIRTKVRGYLAEFKNLEHAAEIRDKRKRLAPIPISESLRIDYRLYYADNHLITLRLTHSVMAIGQMHPIDYYETINFDLRRNRSLEPRDLFKRGYLKVFATHSRRELKDKYDLQYTDDDWIRSGTIPVKSNFDNWNIVPDGILLSFEDYQIASHAFGQAEMIIPYAELRRVLRSNSVARQFVKGKWRRNS